MIDKKILKQNNIQLNRKQQYSQDKKKETTYETSYATQNLNTFQKIFKISIYVSKKKKTL